MAEHDRNDVPGYERRDAPASLPLGVIVFMVLFVPIGLLIVSALMSTFWRMATEPESAFDEPRREIQGPRLQEDPARDYATFSRDIERHLHSMGWVNRDAGIVHLPIERAKQLLLDRGLPEPDSPNRDESSQNRGQEGSTVQPEEPP